jgi:hypothetical protein
LPKRLDTPALVYIFALLSPQDYTWASSFFCSHTQQTLLLTMPSARRRRRIDIDTTTTVLAVMMVKK